MRTVTTATAVAAVLAASTAHAGGLSDQIMEAPVTVEEPMAAPASSISPAIIVLAVLGALLLASSLSDDDEDDDEGGDSMDTTALTMTDIVDG